MGALAVAFQIRRGIGCNAAGRASATIATAPASIRERDRRRRRAATMTPVAARRSRPRLRIGRGLRSPAFRPGIEIGDVVTDNASVLAEDRSPCFEPHLFQGPARQADIMRGL